MTSLSVKPVDFSSSRRKAQEDAQKMQAAVVDECQKSKKEIPPYSLLELIGKGSFGRVYKANAAKTNTVVAVKIIDVDESDTLNPKLSDTYSEFLKEINALQLLSEGGAQNINHVIEALPVGKAMWMVTEYCAGGSVATLMRPTAPGGLQEKWIIPILREVALAIFWVHKQGIIHRDIKCANVLITETGGVQLCDFGVAGMMETKVDKRTTFIGTPHWMAPELFDRDAQYGTEVDIWAFGSMVYEIASGLPPNVHSGVGPYQLGDYLREHIPRLEGDQYSEPLKSLVAYCLEEKPSKRPTIEQVQKHPYIYNTAGQLPSSSLANLVKAYKIWEERGGSRKSLFNPGGAQAAIDLESTSLAADEWNFSTTVAFDEHIHDNPEGMSDDDAVRDVYGTQIDMPSPFSMEDTARPKGKPRRRPPPQVLAAMKAPLEKVFDPNTMTSYMENSRAYYGLPMPPPASDVPPSDLPLREDSLHATIRESLIDLDASFDGIEMSRFNDMDTLKAGQAPPTRASMDNNWSFSAATDTSQYNRAPLSDPADLNNGKHTSTAWKWPTVIPPPASANPDMTHFTFSDDHDVPSPRSGSGQFQTFESANTASLGYDLQVPRTAQERMSMASLIDLDMSMPEPGMPELTRPSTANSDVGSMTGSELGGVNPFELERHASVYAPMGLTAREPSIYVSDDSAFAHQIAKATNGENMNVPVLRQNGRTLSDTSQIYPSSDDDYPQHSLFKPGFQFPPIDPPAVSVMEARATADDVAQEMKRLIASLGNHLAIIGEQVGGMEPRRGAQRLSGQSSTGTDETD